MILRICFLAILLMGFNAKAQNLSVMSYNIRLDIASDGDNAWHHRKDFLGSQILFFEPDILGVQEALPNQVVDLKEALPAYKFIGLGREGADRGEYSGIFYNAGKLEVEKENTFWLSPTPQTIGKGWDAACERICTYGLFTVKNAELKIWVFNTHLDHVGVVAREKGMALILEHINKVNTQNFPVVLMGDFNVEPNSKVIMNITDILDDSRMKAKLVYGPEGTFNGFKYEVPATARIDYIMVSKSVLVEKYATLSSAINSKYPSDHFPVFVHLKLQ